MSLPLRAQDIDEDKTEPRVSTTAADYLFDNSYVPDNTYRLETYAPYKPGNSSYHGVLPVGHSVPARAFKKVEEKGKRQLVLYMAEALGIVTNPDNSSFPNIVYEKYNLTRFLLQKKNKKTGENEYFGPNEKAERPLGSSGEVYPLTACKLNWDVTQQMVTPCITLPEGHEIIYNMIVIINFDDDDIDYEVPKSMIVNYLTEHKTAIIGTLSQTSESYKDDGYGGWLSWMELDKEGNDEDPYPLSYTFAPTESTYDFSLCFDTSFIMDELEISPDADPYLHTMAWVVPFETMRSYTDPSYDIGNDFGVTRWFPGYVGPSELIDGDDYKFKSIHLSGLNPHKLYKLRIDKPTVGYEQAGPTVYRAHEPNVWITAVEYVPEIGAYQLVEHVGEFSNGNQVYYTYDIKKRGKTFKVSLDQAGEVVTCEPFYLDESTAYIPGEYKFTDRMLVMATDMEWVNNPKITTTISNFKGKLVYGEEKYELELTSEGVKFYKVVPLSETEDPLAKIHISLEDYSFDYTTQYGTHMVPGSALYAEKVEINGGNRTFGPYNISEESFFEIQDVSADGQLVVPSPMKQLPEYSFSTDKVVTGNSENNMVNVRMYANDLKSTGQDYLEMNYLLPDLKLHQHDYNVVFPYDNPNVTEALGTIMKEQSKPLFSFYVDGFDQYEELTIDPNENDQAGFFNADLGDIYEVDINQNAVASRSLKLKWTPADYTNIYDRWNDGMLATVDLKLQAPTLNDNLDNKNNANNIYHFARACKNDPSMIEEYLYVSGVDILNTLDNINGLNNNGDALISNEILKNGDADSNYTTLYLLEILDLNNENVVKERILATKEEIKEMKFDLYVSEPIDYNTWMEEYHSDINGKYLIDVNNLNISVKPFRLRNVYLFPIDNEGLLKSSQVFTKQKIALYVDGDEQSTLPVYHGVTTPYVKASYDFSKIQRDDIITGIEGVNDGLVSDSNLVRVGAGSVEVLLDGVDLYGADGILVGNGKGVYKASHGVYIARKGNRIQKVFVK